MSILYHSTYTSPIGRLSILHREEIIHLCEFDYKKERIWGHVKRYYGDWKIEEIAIPLAFQTAFDAYFSGDPNALDGLKTDPRGSDYEQKVWTELRNIPGGATENYGGLAKKIGGHARAIGRANGANPIAIIHPCHRVIGADGSLTGYAGGLKRKAWLLSHEGAGYLPL